MKSHVAEDIVFNIRNDMVLSSLGYVPKKLVPLYVRNTLLEKNGTTPGGDQTQAIMSQDARYTHTFGRPLNRFEPPEMNAELKKKQDSDREKYMREIKGTTEAVEQARLKRKAERDAAKKLKKEQAAVKSTGMSMALLRMAFNSGGLSNPKKQKNYYGEF